MCRAAVVSCLSVVIVRSDIHCVRMVRALVIIGDDHMVVDPLKFGLGSEVERLRGVAVGLWNKHSVLMSEVAAFHTAGVEGNYQSSAYKRFYIRGSDMYFSFREFLKDNAELSDAEFLDAIWLRMVDAVRVMRNVKGGGRDSHCSLFVRLFCDRYGYDRNDEVLARRVRNCYLAYLSWTMGSVLLERRVFSALVERYGALAVRYGSAADESEDVDLWVGDVPVSVKCDSGFRLANLTNYRFKQGKQKPEAYVNEDLAVVVVLEDGSLSGVCGTDELDWLSCCIDIRPVGDEDEWDEDGYLEWVAEEYGSTAAYLRMVEGY